MFIFVLGWLAHHRKGWVVLATGTALIAAGLASSSWALPRHQPLISRAGVLITLVAVIFAALAVRTRHARVRDNPGRAALGESQADA